MIGIYKITNQINGKVYIGQSVNIKRRWNDHRKTVFYPQAKTYDYPLYRAMRKYGIDNFQFEVLEETTKEQLNDRESYWIKFYNSNQKDKGYNQTWGGDHAGHFMKLNEKSLNEIKDMLMNSDKMLKDIAKQYNVSLITIKDINQGHSWYDKELNYPLRKTKNIKHYCCDCGVEISEGATRCAKCNSIKRRIVERPTREELKILIYTKPFTQIAKDFGVSDKAIRKWCISYNLPKRKTDINKYSEEEWEKI